MSGSFADRLPSRRAPLAFALCLLAFLFAVEAKTAMYGPQNGLGSNVRAAKAMPAVTPELVEHRVLTSDPLHPHTAFTARCLISAGSLQSANVPSRTAALRFHLPRFTAAFFSPLHYFRPPPAL
jgi:hypothetical protein